MLSVVTNEVSVKIKNKEIFDFFDKNEESFFKGNQSNEWVNLENISDNLINATTACYEKAQKGDVILLSPACASWDQYKAFEDRGNEFKTTISSFKGE